VTKAARSSPFLKASALIVGEVADEHVAAVVDALNRLDVSTLVFDAAQLERCDHRLDEDGIELDAEAGWIRFEVGRGWIRRYAPPAWREDDAPRTHAGVVRAAWYALLTGAITSLNAEWLTELQHLSFAEQKLYQARAVRTLGYATPRTVVTSRPDLIPPEFGDELVVKPIGPGSYVDEVGQTRVVFANSMRREDERLRQLAAAPFLVQEQISADTHLRVVTVREQAWVCRLDHVDELDWRRDDAAHDAFVKTDAFEEVAQQALGLARTLCVGYSSQDWIVENERFFFIDMNPAGQWLFLPKEVAMQVTEAIAKWLAGDS
jgi:glutathione synthase/RimK-type ligase-like ATP-grasp enzyme